MMTSSRVICAMGKRRARSCYSSGLLDPHAGTEESWAPGFVSRAQKRARPDPEMEGSCPCLHHRRQGRNQSLPSPHWLRKWGPRRREVRQPGVRRNMLSRGSFWMSRAGCQHR
eukprot:6211785-Pyramimonas_sp.AAC.1